MKWTLISEHHPGTNVVVLLSDGVCFAAGEWTYNVEPEMTIRGYGDKPGPYYTIPDDFCERIPNPKAGIKNYFWSLFGCSAFSGETEIEDGDGSIYFTPTHWAILTAPADASAKRKAVGTLT